MEIGQAINRGRDFVFTGNFILKWKRAIIFFGLAVWRQNPDLSPRLAVLPPHHPIGFGWNRLPGRIGGGIEPVEEEFRMSDNIWFNVFALTVRICADGPRPWRECRPCYDPIQSMLGSPDALRNGQNGRETIGPDDP